MTAAPSKVIFVQKPRDHDGFLAQISRSEHSGTDAAAPETVTIGAGRAMAPQSHWASQAG
jgi:hypothetical protein